MSIAGLPTKPNTYCFIRSYAAFRVASVYGTANVAGVIDIIRSAIAQHVNASLGKCCRSRCRFSMVIQRIVCSLLPVNLQNAESMLYDWARIICQSTKNYNAARYFQCLLESEHLPLALAKTSGKDTSRLSQVHIFLVCFIYLNSSQVDYQ